MHGHLVQTIASQVRLQLMIFQIQINRLTKPHETFGSFAHCAELYRPRNLGGSHLKHDAMNGESCLRQLFSASSDLQE